MTLLAGARVVAPGGVVDPGWVEVADARIRQIGHGHPPGPADFDLAGRWLVPGFIDLHVHGGDGASFADEPTQVRRAVGFHRRHGTTTLLASLVTAPPAELSAALDRLASLAEDGFIAGVHLEGPFLSSARCGAHDPTLLRPPDRDALDRLLQAGRGAVRMVTVAPELDGGLDAVRRIADHGAIAAIGHTDADHDTTRAAVAAGARVGTHLFNAMPPLLHRAPGPVGALLADPRVVVEVVNDGHHLHPAVVRTAAAAAGPSRTALITDAMPAAGCGDGRYRLGTAEVVVRDGAARLAEGGALAGSTLTMAEAFRRTAEELGVEAAAVMAAGTPARALDRDDIGFLAPGNRADLVVLDAQYHTTAVMHGGAWVDERRP